MTDRLPASVQQLIATLRAGTEEGYVEWRTTDEPTAFFFSGAGASVIIRSVDGDGRYPYTLDVLNKEGAIIESFDTRELSSEAGERLEGLYHTARRNATDIDKVIQGLVQEIKERKPPF